MEPLRFCRKCGHEEATEIPDLHQVPPNISECISSSFPLHSSQISLVHESLDAARTSSALLDQQMARLQAALRNLDLEQRKVKAAIKKYEGALAPVRNIPAEVLCEIFLAHIHDSRYERGPFYMKGPWVTSQVCGWWREVSLTCAPLWSYIDINGRDETDLDSPFISSNAVRAWISRCGNTPLHITCHGMGYQRAQTYDTEVIGILTDVSERWRSANIEVPPHHLNLLDRVKGRLPLLYRLHLHLRRGQIERDHPMVDAFADAPQLRVVSLTRVNPTFVALPWAQILQYTSSINRSWPHHLAVLNQASSLQKYTLDTFAGAYHYNGTEMTTHRQLRTLVLQLSFHTTVDFGFLDSITLPALEDVTIVNPYAPSQFAAQVTSMDAFTSLLHRSSSPLKTLRLLNIPESTISLLQGVLASPSMTTVTDLHLRFSFTFDDRDWGAICLLLGLLTTPIQEGGHRGLPLPHLERICIGFGAGVHSFLREQSIRSIIDMVASRCRPVENGPSANETLESSYALKAVHLYDPGKCGFKLRRGLQPFVDRGLEVVNHSIFLADDA